MYTCDVCGESSECKAYIKACEENHKLKECEHNKGKEYELDGSYIAECCAECGLELNDVFVDFEDQKFLKELYERFHDGK